jgi:hypothetical protein
MRGEALLCPGSARHTEIVSVKRKAHSPNLSTWEENVQALPDMQKFNVFGFCHQLRTGEYDRGSPSTENNCLL